MDSSAFDQQYLWLNNRNVYSQDVFGFIFLWSKGRDPLEGWRAEVQEWEVHGERRHYKDALESLNESPCLFQAHLSRVSLCSETLTSTEGFVYVTVTSLILRSATWGHFRVIRTRDETASIQWSEGKIVFSSPNTCMYTWLHTYIHTHTQTTHPCSPHTSPSSLCGKLLLITTQSAGLVHIAPQECLKQTVPHTVKPTSSVCSIQLDIWTKSHCLKSDHNAFASHNHVIVLLLAGHLLNQLLFVFVDTDIGLYIKILIGRGSIFTSLQSFAASALQSRRVCELHRLLLSCWPLL